MLPDYTKLKEEILDVLHAFFIQRVNVYCQGTKEIPRYHVFEGKGSTAIIRPNGEKDPTNMKEGSAGFEIEMKDVPFLTINDLANKIDAAAKNMASQITQNLYQTISEVTEKTGNVVKGKPMSAEAILEVYDKMFILFDDNGNPELPIAHIHPNLKEKTIEAFKKIDNDPETKKKYEEIILRKREQYLAEQASRKLVG